LIDLSPEISTLRWSDPHYAGKGSAGSAMSLRFTRRLNRLSTLPPARQKFVLQTIDALLKSASS